MFFLSTIVDYIVILSVSSFSSIEIILYDKAYINQNIFIFFYYLMYFPKNKTEFDRLKTKIKK